MILLLQSYPAGYMKLTVEKKNSENTGRLFGTGSRERKIQIGPTSGIFSFKIHFAF
jgi:hypothetical protein